MKIIHLLINVTKPDRELNDYGGDAVQEGLTNLFATFDSIRCVFIGLFTGVWC